MRVGDKMGYMNRFVLAILLSLFLTACGSGYRHSGTAPDNHNNSGGAETQGPVTGNTDGSNQGARDDQGGGAPQGPSAACTGACDAGTGSASGGDASTGAGGSSSDGGGTSIGNGEDGETSGDGDEGCAGGAAPSHYYQDADGDGYGGMTLEITACKAPSGYVANNLDCNDADPYVNPTADEVCNGIDDNCDGKLEDSKNCGCLGSLARYQPYPNINHFPYDTSPESEHSFSSPGREPSGVVYIPAYDSLFMVSDDGYILRLSTDLSVLKEWYVGGDLEGITYNPSTNTIYVIVEGAQEVREYTYTPGSGALTYIRHWNVSSIIPYYMDNQGIEAVTFVPTSASVQGGVFYIGNQRDGKIYIVEIDLLGTESYEARLFPNAPEGINVIAPPTDIASDISGLNYEEKSGLVYAIWDGSNRMGVIDTKTNQYLLLFKLPSAEASGATENEEGITIDGSCRIFVAEDKISGKSYGRMRRFDP